MINREIASYKFGYKMVTKWLQKTVTKMQVVDSEKNISK